MTYGMHVIASRISINKRLHTMSMCVHCEKSPKMHQDTPIFS